MSSCSEPSWSIKLLILLWRSPALPPCASGTRLRERVEEPAFVATVLDRDDDIAIRDVGELPRDPHRCAAQRDDAVAQQIELGHEHRLRHVRHLAGYDVIARDYLVYEAPGAAPSCVMATNVAGALRHLALAARRAT